MRCTCTCLRAFVLVLFTVSAFPLFSQPLTGTKTIGPSGQYPSLTAALAAANTNGFSGPVVFELQANYVCTVESFPVTLTALSASSASNTITIRPASGANGLALASNNSTATVLFSGSKYITIDGRPGGSGNFAAGTCLRIYDSSGTAPAVLFNNEATYNSLRYCDLQSNNQTIITATSGGGTVCFGTTNGSNGNDYNTLFACDIHAHPMGTPVMGVFSYGTTTNAAQFNDSNRIEACNIYDFNGSVATAGVNLSTGSNGWYIVNNRFYQTQTLSHTTAVTHRCLYVTAGSGYSITGNYIGGNAADGSGYYAINTGGATVANVLFALDYSSAVVGTTTLIRDNTITNLDFSSAASGSGALVLLQIYGGNVDCRNNLIGSVTTNGAIKLTGYNTSSTGVTGMIALRVGLQSNLINLTGNIISGIDLYASSSTGAPEFHGINITSGSATSVYTASNNIVGSPQLPNSINIVSTSTGSTAAARLNAFIINTTAAITSLTLANNTVANLNTNYSGTGTQAASLRGIWMNPMAAGTFYIKDNLVYNLATASQTTGTATASALIGISVSTTTGTVHVSGNSVHSLLLTTGSTTAAVQCEGITFTGIATANNVVERNFVRGLSLTAQNPTATITGINLNTGSITAQNNMVSLGYDSSGSSITTPCSFRGLLTGSGSINLYHNSIYIGGTGVGNSTTNTFAFQRGASVTQDIRNNIFMNVRSNTSAGGKHYQVFLVDALLLTLNYNVYHGTGTGSVFASANNGSSDVSGYASGWVTGDANSVISNPGFLLPAAKSSLVNLHVPATAPKGIALAAIIDDADKDIRNAPPYIGADEVPYDLGILVIDSPVTAFCSGTRNIYVKLRNYGQQTITSASLRVGLNGAFITAFSWSGNLAPNGTTASTLIGSINFSAGNSLLSVHSTSPNGMLDNNANNDSAKLNISVTNTVTPALSISTFSSTVCTGTAVVFKAAFANGGNNPVFQWMKNNVSVGSNDSSYTLSSPVQGDSIQLTLTSNAACSTTPVVTSNTVKLTVSSSLVPAIAVTSTADTVCQGTAVKYTASVSNDGPAAHYQWLKNGVAAGTDSIVYLLNNPSDQDVIRCVLTSSLSCASKPRDTAAAKIITVKPIVAPVAVVQVSSSTICAGTSDTFTVAVSNGGRSPVFQWFRNSGLTVGTNSNTYITNSLANGDSIYVNVTSNATCVTPLNVNSNKVGVTVKPMVTPSVTISGEKYNICAGDSVKFFSAITNGGTAPQRSWFKNGIQLPGTTDTLLITGINHNDNIRMTVISNASCLTQTNAQSNSIVMSVSPMVTPSVSVNATKTTLCSGEAVKFTASATGAGSFPHFVWRRNGIAVGSDSVNYTTNQLSNGDSIQVILLSDAGCKTKASDTSQKTGMTVNAVVVPSLNIAALSSTYCNGGLLQFNINPVNSGPNLSLDWKRNALPLSPDSFQFSTYYFNTNGFLSKDTIYAVLHSTASCAVPKDVTSNKVVVSKTPAVVPVVTVVESKNDICKGTTVVFTATPVNGGTAPHYTWLKNRVAVGPDQFQFSTDSLNNNDTVSVILTSDAPCASPASDTSNHVVMKVNNTFVPDLVIFSSVDPVCAGGVVTFTASPTNEGATPVYTWSKNNVKIGSDSIKMTTTLNPGDQVKCVLRSSLTCAIPANDTALSTIQVNPNPVKPTITRNIDTLKSSSVSGNQWFFNGNMLSGATQRFHRAAQNGNYTVRVDSNGCSSISNAFDFHFTSLSDLNSRNTIRFYPNPTSGIVLVETGPELKPADIQLIDLMGRSCAFGAEASGGAITLDLSGLENGWYVVCVNHDGKRIEQKIILQR